MSDTRPEEKKRKREADKGDRPRKRVEVEGQQSPASTVKVSILSASGESCPVIASTPGLCLPAGITFGPYKKVAAEKRPPQGSTTPHPSRYELLLHSSTHPRLDYTARSERDGSADSLLKHYVAVFDPATGALKVVEAQKLVVRGALRPEAAPQQADSAAEASNGKPTMSAQRQTLGLEFGTKKARKAIASLTENAIAPTRAGPDGAQATADPLAAATLDSISANTASMPTRESLQAAVDASKPRPPANLAATTPAEVYTPEALIGAEELKMVGVKEWMDAFENKEDVKTHSRFVSRRLRGLAERKDGKGLKVLRYLLLLLDFYAALKAGRGGGRRLPPKEELAKKMGGVQSALVEGVRRRFAEGSEMTKWHVDNLLTHAAALALVVDNFETDVHDLREDLRLDNKQIAQYFHEIGCRVGAPTEAERQKMKITKAEAASHRMARLRLPLDFPRQRNIPLKRR